MLEQFIFANKLEAELIPCEKDVDTVKQAAALLGCEPGDIVKSLLFIVDGEPVLALLPGDKRASEEKLLAHVQGRDARLASPEETEEITGYAVGGVPPVSIYGVKSLLDESILKKEWVFAGGGDNKHMLKIRVADIQLHGFEVEPADLAV